MVRIVLIIALALLQLLVGIPGFMADGPYPERAALYSFFHASWWHLAVNAIAIWTIFDPRRKFNWSQIVTVYLIAVVVYPLSFRPVIGFSNVLYAMLGLRTPPLSSPWWKRPEVLAFLILTAAMVFIPRLSATTHVAAFALGMAAASAKRKYLYLTRDIRRYL